MSKSVTLHQLPDDPLHILHNVSNTVLRYKLQFFHFTTKLSIQKYVWTFHTVSGQSSNYILRYGPNILEFRPFRDT